jgi:quinol monooxygenase YgiN
MTQKLTVVARIRALPGNEEKVRAALLALIPPTRQERGCINYDLHQSVDDPALFMFYENWENRHALDLHMKTPHLQSFRENYYELLAEPVELVFWEQID